MELIQGIRKAFKFEPEDCISSTDYISSMPDIVVSDILDRLPLQDAVRTCILARNWRFKWTTLSRLVFDKKFLIYLSKTQRVSDYGRIVSRLLLHIKGVILKFVLYVDDLCNSVHVEDISHWILFLSRKGIRDLSLEKKKHETPLSLPIHLFSCLELKHLKLFNCVFVQPAGFHGFPNLLSLKLRHVKFESGKFGEFSAQSHLLEILKLAYTSRGAKVKPVEITKHVNLKILSLSLRSLDNTLLKSSSFIFELVGSLPRLQELALDFYKCEFTEDGAKTRFPTTFSCLKTLELSGINLDNGIMLSCAFEMLRSFPNLQTLLMRPRSHLLPPVVGSPEVDDYNTMRLLQLQSVFFTYSTTSENEVCLIKYLLACSPSLKKIVIRPIAQPEPKEKFMFAKKLLKLHRASPVVDINLS